MDRGGETDGHSGGVRDAGKGGEESIDEGVEWECDK